MFQLQAKHMEKTKAATEHDYHLGTSLLVEIPSFRKTKYFAQNIQYFKFFNFRYQVFLSTSKVLDRNSSFFVWNARYFKNMCQSYSIGSGCIKLNWLCKHIKTVKSSQASMLLNSCTKLTKTVFSCEQR